MSKITTHVLDVAGGRPAEGISVTLSEHDNSGEWIVIGTSTTDRDGRAGDLLEAGTDISLGTYRLRFDTGGYFESKGIESFYPEVSVTFSVKNAQEHFHVPVLLSPFGFTTYRGS
jgi:5-hydroxyisourate hydrolase